MNRERTHQKTNGKKEKRLRSLYDRQSLIGVCILHLVFLTWFLILLDFSQVLLCAAI